MKKILYLFTACCIATLAQAQTLTEKDLQGNWAIHSFHASGIIVDAVTGEVSFSDEIKSQLTPELEQQIKGQMAGASEALKGGTINIDGNNLTRTISGTSKKGTYALKETDGKQSIVITYDDGTSNEVGIAKVDNMLSVTAAQNGQQAEFRYTKQ